MRPCPTCGAPVIGPPDRPLNAAPHDLGIWAADGRKLTVGELRAAIRTKTTVGHHQHICAAPAQQPADDNQASLF